MDFTVILVYTATHYVLTSSYKYISSSVDLTLLEWALGQLDKTYQMDELHVLLLWKTYIVRYV